jgi:tetratricopeptide (TPR) repeat protein
MTNGESQEVNVAPSKHTSILKFRALKDQTYSVALEGSEGEDHSGEFTLPYDPPTWTAILQALEPGFDLSQADEETQKALEPLEPLDCLPETVGQALAEALFVDGKVRSGFDAALREAEAAREPLPVELRFGPDCDTLAALSWELLHHKGRFLVADSSICLSRCPASAAPPTPALTELPLRVLLVLSEPLDSSPILPDRAREQLVHGLRALDEEGAVIVDLLSPPTFDTLVEAVRNGGYHMLVFYGHGVYDADEGGQLLFEDRFGGQALVKASELGAALRNTEVRLVLLGACQSAQTHAGGEGDGVWSGTAPALLQAGVPLAIGMQVSMRVDAAQAFIRQFALSLAAGKPVGESVADARTPLIRGAYGKQWFVPALYGRPADVDRLFDPDARLPEDASSDEAVTDLRRAMKELRVEIAELERDVAALGTVRESETLARLRTARREFAEKRAELARRTPGGYTQVTSPLYGVPSNPIFVGRSRELREVAQGLHRDHPDVIWGVGGIGKTALVAEVAQRQSWRFPAGVLWLDCRGNPPLDTLLNRIGAFCGMEAIEQVEPDKKESTVRMALARLDGRCLLVWDNVEAVWENRAVRQFVRGRLPDNCQSLLTTRKNPEQPMWHTVELRPLADAAMETLFMRLAVAAGVKIGGPADVEAIPKIIEHLKGHPLAMTLVVPLAQKRGIRRVWRELQQRPLKGIDAAFALSYERLTRLQRQLFARLSVFTIPFEWDAARALLPDEGAHQVDEALDVLVQRALVSFDGARYAYHALVRQYAYGKLKALEDDDPRPVHRLAAEYLEAKLTDEKRGGTPEEGLEAVDQWERAEAWERFAQSAHRARESLDRLGYWAEIQERLERALAAVEEHLEEPPLEATLLNDLGMIADNRAEWDRAIEMYERSLETKERVGDVHGMAQTFNNLGLVYADKGEWDRAIAMYERSLESLERVGDVHGMAQTWTNLGSVYYRKGEWDRAIAMYERSLETKERVGDVHGMAQTWGNLGNVYAQQGEWDRAIEMYERSLETKERVGDVHGMARTWGNLGIVYRKKGEWERAIAMYERSLETKERVGDVHGMAQTWTNMALLYLETDRAGEAKPLLARAYSIFAQLGSPHAQTAANALVRACGSVDAANAYLTQLTQEQPDEM